MKFFHFDPTEDFMEKADRVMDPLPPKPTTKYKYNYVQPERLASSEIRQRRLAAELDKQRKALEVNEARLSPANKIHAYRLKEFSEKFASEIKSRKRLMTQSPFNIRSKSRLFQLLLMQRKLQERAASERTSSKLEKSFVDRSFGLKPPVVPKFFVDPTGAWISKMKFAFNPVAQARFSGKKALANIPCVDRLIRKEVLFAKGKAGKGHRSPHHKGPLSHIGC